MAVRGMGGEKVGRLESHGVTVRGELDALRVAVTVNDKAARLAVLTAEGEVGCESDALAREVLAMTVKFYRNYLGAEGWLAATGTPLPTVEGIVVRADQFNGLSVTVNGQPARLAVVAEGGVVVAEGDAVTEEAFAASINLYREFLRDNGLLRDVYNPRPFTAAPDTPRVPYMEDVYARPPLPAPGGDVSNEVREGQARAAQAPETEGLWGQLDQGSRPERMRERLPVLAGGTADAPASVALDSKLGHRAGFALARGRLKCAGEEEAA